MNCPTTSNNYLSQKKETVVPVRTSVKTQTNIQPIKQTEVQRLAGELKACHEVTLQCYRDIAQLKSDISHLQEKIQQQAQTALQANERLKQQSAIIDDLQHKLHERITATQTFLQQMQELDQRNGEQDETAS
jgi:uncharacterized coiled-coil DUF342 family protein